MPSDRTRSPPQKPALVTDGIRSSLTQWRKASVCGSRRDVALRLRFAKRFSPLYEVHLPEQIIDGVIFQPTTQFLRIEE
jgi:hypothetical protein